MNPFLVEEENISFPKTTAVVNVQCTWCVGIVVVPTLVLSSFVDVDILGLSLCSFWSNVQASVVLPSTLRFWLLKSVHTASECQLLSDFRLCLSTESEYRFSFSWIFFALYLSFQNPYVINNIHTFRLWFCTLEQILAYPIDPFNTLLSSKLFKG